MYTFSLQEFFFWQTFGAVLAGRVQLVLYVKAGAIEFHLPKQPKPVLFFPHYSPSGFAFSVNFSCEKLCYDWLLKAFVFVCKTKM